MGWTGMGFFQAGICTVYFFFPVFPAEFGGLKNQSLIHHLPFKIRPSTSTDIISAHEAIYVFDSIILGQSLT